MPGTEQKNKILFKAESASPSDAMPGTEQKTKIALIQGGLGAEREVSLLSAQAVARAFKALNISYQVVESDKDLVNKLYHLKPDKAFLAVHGKYAEDGTLQGICEYLKIPYTGSGVLGSSLCMDKCVFKNYLSWQNIPTPHYQVLKLENQKIQEVVPTVSFPLVVKPSREGSTLGISICKNKKELISALEKALSYDTKILLEAYIEGMELAVSFFNGKTLMPVEIIPQSGFYDYTSKYKAGKTQYILPPRLKKNIIKTCQNITQKVVKSLPIKTYCRADFIVRDSLPLMTEINTLPGLTEHSLLPKSAQYEGIDFNTLILHILQATSLDYSFHK